MMKITFASKNGRMSIEVEAKEQTDAFEQIASFQEVFEESKCGACQDDNLRLVVRSVDDNKFYELHCQKCRARLAYGQHKKGGTLFPRRKSDDGKWLDKSGWTKWNAETKKEE
jgi:hypothetical protein